MNKQIQNNSEILFIYDAKNCNPNGDMDNENKPRMDYDTNTNLVSDVRLKRYIRDYLNKFKEKEIFIKRTNKDITSDKRAKELEKNNIDWKTLIDVKLFGGIVTIKTQTDNLTGPVQFNWGYSLNNVELLESKTITSTFKTSGKAENTGGSGIGKDYRVKYSFIAFSGSINKKVAEETKLTEEELKLLDEAMINSIQLCRTRSKIGQSPRLYLRVVMKDNKTLNDLREYITLEKTDELTSIEDVILNVSELKKYLEENKDKIEKIILWKDSKLKFNEEFEVGEIEIEELNS